MMLALNTVDPLAERPVDGASAMSSRRLLFATVGALLLAAAPLAARGAGGLQAWTGEPDAPPIKLLTPDGRPLALSDLKGRVVVVNFWASWCEPCVDEMPSMQRLRETLAGEAFEILAVNFQEGEPRIRSFLQKVPVGFPIVRDTDGGVARAWKVRIFPSSFVVDPEGRIRYALVGAVDWSAADIEQTLRELLPTSRQGSRRR